MERASADCRVCQPEGIHYRKANINGQFKRTSQSPCKEERYLELAELRALKLQEVAQKHSTTVHLLRDDYRRMVKPLILRCKSTIVANIEADAPTNRWPERLLAALGKRFLVSQAIFNAHGILISQRAMRLPWKVLRCFIDSISTL